MAYAYFSRRAMVVSSRAEACNTNSHLSVGGPEGPPLHVSVVFQSCAGGPGGPPCREVGSERYAKSELSRPVLSGCRLQVLRAGFNRRDGVAVSYTHLRAHETPEHLVCR